MNAPWISNTCPHWWPFFRHKSVYFPFVLYTKFSLDNFSAGAASSTGPAANCRSAAAWGRCCPGAVKRPAATTGLATITFLSFTFISFHLFSFSLPFIREDCFLFHSFLRLEKVKKSDMVTIPELRQNTNAMNIRRPFDPTAHELDANFRLTRFADLKGWGCKVPREVLLKLLEGLEDDSGNEGQAQFMGHMGIPKIGESLLRIPVLTMYYLLTATLFKVCNH